ncbi:sigma-70 family RNA polymerase sigma factor [Streptomyces sp. NBC_01497]|uniref:sigma-70 family RNA polymerase sigma factor n=1 Tax=Streptomyces sp. NBC_01497 TaxID=2903885 RepID=UPI002E2FD67A|nr:sigma-70 family RNA polymerase sigma factor [Streptomyces sp. NBC_01497]
MQVVMGSKGSAEAKERAVRQCYEAHGDALYAFVLHLVRGDKYKAEDIVQEAMLRSWLKDSPLGGEGIRPWLFRVARNLVVDDHRRTKARPAEVYAVSAPETTESTEDGIDATVDSLMVRRALRSLTSSHREILVQTYLMNNTGHEVAEELNIPLGTVKSRSHYALRALREAIVEPVAA